MSICVMILTTKSGYSGVSRHIACKVHILKSCQFITPACSLHLYSDFKKGCSLVCVVCHGGSCCMSFAWWCYAASLTTMWACKLVMKCSCLELSAEENRWVRPEDAWCCVRPHLAFRSVRGECICLRSVTGWCSLINVGCWIIISGFV